MAELSNSELASRIENLEKHLNIARRELDFLRLLTNTQFAAVAKLANATDTWVNASIETVEKLCNALSQEDQIAMREFVDEYKADLEHFRHQ